MCLHSFRHASKPLSVSAELKIVSAVLDVQVNTTPHGYIEELQLVVVEARADSCAYHWSRDLTMILRLGPW